VDAVSSIGLGQGRKLKGNCWRASTFRNAFRLSSLGEDGNMGSTGAFEARRRRLAGARSPCLTPWGYDSLSCSGAQEEKRRRGPAITTVLVVQLVQRLFSARLGRFASPLCWPTPTAPSPSMPPSPTSACQVTGNLERGLAQHVHVVCYTVFPGPRAHRGEEGVLLGLLSQTRPLRCCPGRRRQRHEMVPSIFRWFHGALRLRTMWSARCFHAEMMMPVHCDPAAAWSDPRDSRLIASPLDLSFVFPDSVPASSPTQCFRPQQGPYPDGRR
jgi:hypothetical protein